MADTLVEGALRDTQDATGVWGPYWSDKDTAVFVFLDDGADISFARTIDAGISWGTTEIEAGGTRALACWYDKETPGNSGTLVHMAWLDNGGADAANYRTLNVSDASLGTAREIVTGITVDAISANNKMSITKTVGGNLLVAFSTQTEIECKRSTDGGAVWTDRDDVFELGTEEDWLQLFPANTADNNDACGIFLDRSGNNLSIKMYDDNLDNWVETSIDTGIVDLTHFRNTNFGGAVRHSDNHLLIGAHSSPNDVGDDLRTWDLTVDDINTPTITAKTNVFTGQDISGHVEIIINQQNDDVYLVYMKGGTWGSLVDIVFHKSTDGMGAWGGELAYSETTGNYRAIGGGRTISSAGGRIQWGFYNDGSVELFVNLVNDIEIVADVGGPGPAVRFTGEIAI